MIERDLSQLDVEQLISIYTSLGKSSSEFKDNLSAAICMRLDDLSDEQFWLFVSTNEKVISELNRIGHNLDYTVGYARRQKELFKEMLK